MWYEILPSAAIIVACMGGPHVSAYIINKLICGNSYRRSLLTEDLQRQYMRDTRLTGNPYKLASLDGIPDQ